MCIGIPMQVIEQRFGQALCEGMGQKRLVDTLLVGDQPEGTWLLVFLQSAREVISEADAQRIADAVLAVNELMDPQRSMTDDASAMIDQLFPDLVGREPPKPPSLLALEARQGDSSLAAPIKPSSLIQTKD